MGGSCRIDVVNGFTYPVQSSRGADSEICHGHIIVYRAYEADYLEVAMSFSLLLGNRPLKEIGGQQTREDIRSPLARRSATS
jgi:hypothetical protein